MLLFFVVCICFYYIENPDNVIINTQFWDSLHCDCSPVRYLMCSNIRFTPLTATDHVVVASVCMQSEKIQNCNGNYTSWTETTTPLAKLIKQKWTLIYIPKTIETNSQVKLSPN